MRRSLLMIAAVVVAAYIAVAVVCVPRAPLPVSATVLSSAAATPLSAATCAAIPASLSSTAPCRTIEEHLRQQPYLSSAECYTTCDGIRHIVVAERRPLLHVVAAATTSNRCVVAAADYYLCGDGTRLATTAATDVPVVYACGDDALLLPLARALAGDTLLTALVQQVVVDSATIRLLPLLGVESTFAADSSTLATSVAQVADFYRYALATTGIERYSSVHVAKNHLVARRRGTFVRK